MKYLTIFISVLIILFCSCGAGDVHKVGFQNSKNIDKSSKKVWNTALTIMARDFNVIKSISEVEFMVQYDYHEITVDDMYKYTTTEGGEYVVARRSIFIEVKGDSVQSKIIVSTDYEGLWQGLDPVWGTIETGFQKLYSNGRFEKEFFAKLENELK